MAAKHITIAKTQGVEAGYEAYMSAPISKQYPLYKEITKKRTDATKLAAYCNHFGLTDTMRVVNTEPNTVIEDSTISDKQATIEALVEAGVISAAQGKKAIAKLNGESVKNTGTTPWMGCWDRKKIGNVKADGTFVYRGKRGASTLKTLSHAEAVALVTANMEAGRVFTIKVS